MNSTITGNEPVGAFLQMQTLLKISQQNNLFDAFIGYCACVAAEVAHQAPPVGAAEVPTGGERTNRGWPQP